MGWAISSDEKNVYQIVRAVQQLLQGRSNAVGQVTLTPNAGSTVVTKSTAPGAVNVAKDSEVFLTPRTANAAAALATTYISAVGQGTFTVTHANNAQADKTFGFECRG